MKLGFTLLAALASLLLLCGCTQPPLETELVVPDQNSTIQPVVETPLVEGRAENLVLTLDDFNAESFMVAQFEGDYSKDTTSLQQFKTFFKPFGHPIILLDENTFVITQTLTLISSSTAREEIENLYKIELAEEKEKHSIAMFGTGFTGEKSIMIKTELEGNDLYKAFFTHSNSLNEMSLLTVGMDPAAAKEKLIYYCDAALARLQ